MSIDRYSPIIFETDANTPKVYDDNGDIIDLPITGTVNPTQIVQQEPGTAISPTIYIPWEVFFANSDYPPVAMRLFGVLFNTTVDPVFELGVNVASEKPTKARCTWVIESDYEQFAGIHVLECYWQTERTPGVDAARPISFSQFLTGPDAGQVGLQLQYRGFGMTLEGGPAGATRQWQISDGQFIFKPNYQLFGEGTLTINTNTTRLTLESSNSDVLLHGKTQLLLVSDNIFIGGDSSGAQAVIQELAPGSFEFYPTVDGVGNIGRNANRWALVRAVTITSGDLHLQDESRNAHWILREHPDFIEAINVMTNETNRLAMISDIEKLRNEINELRKAILKKN